MGSHAQTPPPRALSPRTVSGHSYRWAWRFVGPLIGGTLALAGCGRGDAEVDALAAHVRAVVERIEAHRGDPNGALRAISAYEHEHAQELESLRAASKALRRDLGTQAKRALHARWSRETEPLRARLRALRAPSK